MFVLDSSPISDISITAAFLAVTLGIIEVVKILIRDNVAKKNKTDKIDKADINTILIEEQLKQYIEDHKRFREYVLPMIKELYDSHLGIKSFDKDGIPKWYISESVKKKLEEILEYNIKIHENIDRLFNPTKTDKFKIEMATILKEIKDKVNKT